MVQFNLLPDIKLEYIRAAKTKRLVILVATISSLAVVGFVALLAFFTFVVRGGHLTRIDKDIDTAQAELANTEDIDKILTIQNQLSSLPQLHDAKPKATRLFEYLSQSTPSDVSISDFDVDFAENTISISGEATSLTKVNEYVDTIKFAEMVVQPDDISKEAEANSENIELPKPTITKAFSEVVLSSFGLEDSVVAYKIDFKYDPTLFNSTKKTSLNIPNKLTTRSETEKPIFQESTIKKEEE